MPVVDASELTKRKQGRMLYANYVIRSTSVNKNPGLIARPLATGSPIGSGSGVNYANYIEEVVQGNFQTTPAEQQEIINRNFPTPAAPVIPPGPLTPDATPQDTTSWGYYIIYEGGDNYQYIIYDDTTKAWTGPVDSDINIVDYGIDDLISYTPTGFVIGYYSENEIDGYYRYVLEYLSYTGSLLDTISYIENGDSGFDTNQYVTFIHYLDPDTPLFTLQLYNNETNGPIKTATFSSDYFVDNFVLLRTGVYIILSNDYITYTHYIWNINDDAPTYLFSTYSRGINGGCRYVIFNNNGNVFYDYVVVLGSSDGVHCDTIYCAQGNKTLTTYTIPNATNYTDFGYFYNYGAYDKNLYLNIYNSFTDSRDYFLFRTLPDVRPTDVLLNVTGPIIDTSYHNDDPNEYNTGITNTLIIMEKEPIPYYINTGGVEPLFDAGGNLIKVTIDSSYSGRFISSSGYWQNYGAKVNTTANPYDDDTQYGYLVSPPNVYPHNSTAFVSDLGGHSSGNHSNGYLEIGLYDRLPGDSANYTLDKHDGAYATSTGRYGSYYTQQLYGATGRPSVCHVWFTIQSDNWSSYNYSLTDNRISSVTYDYNASIGINGYNIILCKVLLSAYSAGAGAKIENTAIGNFLSNYVVHADLMSDENDFSTLDMVIFRNWQQSTNYAGSIPNFYSYTYDYNTDLNGAFANGKIHTSFEGLPIVTKELTGNTRFSYPSINKACVTFLLSNDYSLASEVITPTSDISMNIFNINLYDATYYYGNGYINWVYTDNYTFWYVPVHSQGNTPSQGQFKFFGLDSNCAYVVAEGEAGAPADTGGYRQGFGVSKDSAILLTTNTIYIFINGVWGRLYITDYDYYDNQYDFDSSYPDTGNGYTYFWYTDGAGNLSNILTSSTGYSNFLVSGDIHETVNMAMISNCAFYYANNYNVLNVTVAYTDGNVHDFSVGDNEDETNLWFPTGGVYTTPNGFYLSVSNTSIQSNALLTYTLSNNTFLFETIIVPPTGQNIDYNYSTYNLTWGN